MKLNKLLFVIVFFSNIIGLEGQNTLLNCDNKQALLKFDSDYNAIFNFELTKFQQFDNIQSQIHKNICDGMFLFNGQYVFSNKDTVELFTVIERFCKDSVIDSDDELAPCVLVRRKRIKLISNDSIFLDNSYIELNHLSDSVYHKINDFFIKNDYKMIAFDLDWKENTSIIARENVLKVVIEGYLLKAMDLSLEMFDTDLCTLDKEQLTELKRKFYLLISIEFPTSLSLPSNLNIETGSIIQDSIYER